MQIVEEDICQDRNANENNIRHLHHYGDEGGKSQTLKDYCPKLEILPLGMLPTTPRIKNK